MDAQTDSEMDGGTKVPRMTQREHGYCFHWTKIMLLSEPRIVSGTEEALSEALMSE